MKRVIAVAALTLLVLGGLQDQRVFASGLRFWWNTGSVPAGVRIYPGDAYQDSIDAYPAGTAFVTAAGDTLWCIPGQTQGNRVYSYSGACICEGDSLANACNVPEDLFMDDAPLVQVLAKDSVTTVYRWFFSYSGFDGDSIALDASGRGGDSLYFYWGDHDTTLAEWQVQNQDTSSSITWY